jgi:aryl-alcohol dehydrogenase-like predicted oxidoreductase
MWRGNEDTEALRALNLAIDRGVNFVDTALAYGEGHSEQLIGKLLKSRTERIYVASKIPPKNRKWPATSKSDYREWYPAQYIKDSTHTSMKNLGIERLDIQQLHTWTDSWVGVDEIWKAAEDLKKAGDISSFGISVVEHQPDSALKAAATGHVDVFQVIYNIFDQSPEDEFLPVCAKMNIGVIVRVPFDEGGLTGKITPETVFPDGDWRHNYFRGDRKKEVYDRAKKLEPLLDSEAKSLPELALRFCLAQAAVSTVIPGMRTTRNVEANTDVSDGREITEELRGELKKQRWVRSYYD